MTKSLNEIALQIISPIIDDPKRYGARITKSRCGATVVDMGVEADGSWLGAKLYVEAAFGGMAEFSYGRMQVKDLELPTAQVQVHNPMLSIVACHAAAWKLSEGEFPALGSGPVRLKARADRWVKRVEYEDTSNYALLQLQMPQLPDDSMLEHVAEACHIPASNLTAMIAPSASLVGSVQVACRPFKQCMVAIARSTTFDVSTILYGYSTAPVAPVVRDELLAMARINNALIYGGTANFWLRHPSDEEVRRTTESGPFSANAGAHYGKSYLEIFNAYGRDIYKIPGAIDRPAKVMMSNLLTGSVFVAGKIDEENLFRMFTTDTEQVPA